jgi:hypothetical protein
MAQLAAEPVELPDDQGVAGTQLVEDLGEGGAVGAGAAGGLGELWLRWSTRAAST